MGNRPSATNTMATLQEKYEDLCASLLSSGSVLVAFSGGVDSALLLDVAHEVLEDEVLAVTARSAFVPERETAEALSFCSARGIAHMIIDEDVLSDESISSNPTDRCYHCKRRMLEHLTSIASERGLVAVIDGTNADDMGDVRPGARALSELGERSPLAEAGLTKLDIRELARQRGLVEWDKPSLACLASRIPYGEEITAEKLTRIDKAEQLLIDAGFSQVRVRAHGNIARIEVIPSEFNMLLGLARTGMSEAIHDLGFAYVTLDVDGFRSGSMNL